MPEIRHPVRRSIQRPIRHPGPRTDILDKTEKKTKTKDHNKKGK